MWKVLGLILLSGGMILSPGCRAGFELVPIDGGHESGDTEPDGPVQTDGGEPATDVDLPRPSCDNRIQDGLETDVDCGGPCEPCAAGMFCLVMNDCISHVCEDTRCQEPDCEDGVHNGDETDRDCGGSCTSCQDESSCNGDADCLSGICDAGTCQPGTDPCQDGSLNGDETDVDCGGSCPPCADGSSCQQNTDCQSGNCQGGACEPMPDLCSDPCSRNQDCRDCGEYSACNLQDSCCARCVDCPCPW